MSKNPANRTAADHFKQGLKNIPHTYNTLYNRPAGPGGGGKTVPTNLKVIATGKTGKGMPKQPAATRAKVAAMGAASVTPLGPVAAFASGVANSVKKTNAAKAAAASPKPAPATAPKLKIKQPAPASSAAPAPKAGVVPKAPPKPGMQIGAARAAAKAPAAPSLKN